MATTPSRKLAVILHADVVGSTKLVRINETLAHQRIQDAFQRFSRTIASYGGIAHELRGDALLAEFSRSSDAVAASLAYQAENANLNAMLDDEIRPAIRVGIAMGEVVIADNTITGDGVVLAQRLEQLAQPDGVCIHDAAYQTVPKRLPFVYESLSEQTLKGFDQPVRAHRVTLEPGVATPSPEHRGAAQKFKAVWRRTTAAVLALVLVGAGALVWWQSRPPDAQSSSVEGTEAAIPEQLSIAVLPFTNMSGHPEQEYFSDGITEDLITDLSKLSGLFVIARNSTFVYKGKHVDIPTIA